MPAPDLTLPAALAEHVSPTRIDERPRGRLGNRLFHIREATGPGAWLKIGTGRAAQDLVDEARRLEWIGERLPVPRVLCLIPREDEVFLLLSGLPGRPAHECVEELGEERVVACLAEAMRLVHALPAGDCPFRTALDDELAEAERLVRGEKLDQEGFQAATGHAPQRALRLLRERRGELREAVVTHGDLCLPNLLLHDGGLAGIVDWGLAGVADPHRDLMSAEFTLGLNLGSEWLPALHRALGDWTVTRENVDYHVLLDEFFAHARGL